MRLKGFPHVIFQVKMGLKLKKEKKKERETRMTAIVLKRNPNI